MIGPRYTAIARQTDMCLRKLTSYDALVLSAKDTPLYAATTLFSSRAEKFSVAMPWCYQQRPCPCMQLPLCSAPEPKKGHAPVRSYHFVQLQSQRKVMPLYAATTLFSSRAKERSCPCTQLPLCSAPEPKKGHAPVRSYHFVQLQSQRKVMPLYAATTLFSSRAKERSCPCTQLPLCSAPEPKKGHAPVRSYNFVQLQSKRKVMPLYAATTLFSSRAKERSCPCTQLPLCSAPEPKKGHAPVRSYNFVQLQSQRKVMPLYAATTLSSSRAKERSCSCTQLRLCPAPEPKKGHAPVRSYHFVQLQSQRKVMPMYAATTLSSSRAKERPCPCTHLRLCSAPEPKKGHAPVRTYDFVQLQSRRNFCCTYEIQEALGHN